MQDNQINLTYTKLYVLTTKSIGRIISFRDFQAHVKTMCIQGVLNKFDPTGSRGSKVSLSLSKSAIKKARLNILNLDDNAIKLKKLYALILTFQNFRRFMPLTDRQINSYLKKLGTEKKALKLIAKIPPQEKYPGMLIHGSIYAPVEVFESVRGIQFIRYIKASAENKNDARLFYYPITPGFSADEFLEYLEILRKGRDPRPYAPYPPVVPYLDDIQTTREELVKAIETLRSEQILKVIDQIIPDEKRYDIQDTNLKSIIQIIWLIHDLDIFSIIGRMHSLANPSTSEREVLKQHFDQRKLDNIMIATAYQFLRCEQKRYKNKRELDQRKKVLDKSYRNERNAYVDILNSKYKKVINEYSYIVTLLEEMLQDKVTA